MMAVEIKPADALHRLSLYNHSSWSSAEDHLHRRLHRLRPAGAFLLSCGGVDGHAGRVPWPGAATTSLVARIGFDSQRPRQAGIKPGPQENHSGPLSMPERELASERCARSSSKQLRVADARDIQGPNRMRSSGIPSRAGEILQTLPVVSASHEVAQQHVPTESGGGLQVGRSVS